MIPMIISLNMVNPPSAKIHAMTIFRKIPKMEVISITLGSKYLGG
jgi:fumarate reductase subunit C